MIICCLKTYLYCWYLTHITLILRISKIFLYLFCHFSWIILSNYFIAFSVTVVYWVRKKPSVTPLKFLNYPKLEQYKWRVEKVEYDVFSLSLNGNIFIGNRDWRFLVASDLKVYQIIDTLLGSYKYLAYVKLFSTTTVYSTFCSISKTFY